MATQPTYVARKGFDAEFADTDIDGDLAVSGTITGNVTGNITGDITGNVTGGLNEAVTLVTADGAIAIPTVNTTYIITKAGVAAMTIVAPAAGDNGVRLTFISATANAHTLDMASTGLNEGSADIGTFGGAKGDGVTLIAYNQHWYQVPGSNANVTFA
jgi:hypothetical protein